jgi:replicative DNA helicase
MRTQQDHENIVNNTAMVERALVGAVLVENSLMNEIDLSHEQFWLSECAMIFSAIEALHAERKPMDLVTVSEWLNVHRNVDYFTEIAECARNSPSAAAGKTYADKVREYWRSREACRIASELIEIKFTNEQDMIDLAISQLMSLNTVTKSHNHNIKTILSSAVNDIEDAMRSEDGCTGLKTGIEEIDDVLGGFHKTDLIVVGARPAMGKTALLLNMVTRHESMKPGLISAEQGHNQVGMRLLSIHGSVNGARMRKGEIDDDEWAKITAATGQLIDRNIWVNDKPAMSINDIERQARKWVHENGVNIIGVDYLQKIKHPNSRLSTVEKIGDIAVRLKDLAKELDIPVIALAQVNRKVEERADKRPFASDIKDCGIIEQEADQILTLYREEVYNEGQRLGTADINFCKNRHGPTGEKTIVWVSKYMQFNSMGVN